MKKTISMLVVAALLFGAAGCMKSDEPCTEKTVASEEGAIQSFATANSLPAVRHSSGLYYYIENPGSGTAPTASSTIKANYVGKYMDGTVFDQSVAGMPVTFSLAGVLPGWQIGVPLISEGGIIHLIIPSSLAYGCNGYSTIPKYAVLYFKVELLDVL